MSNQSSESDSTKIKKVVVTSYSLKELMGIYNVSKYKMLKKMKPYKNQIGEKHEGNSFDAEQINLIFSLIRVPSNVQIIKVQE